MADGANWIETNPYKGRIKKVRNKNSYAILLPIPEIEVIENQIIENKVELKTFKGESEMEIEPLFYGDGQTHGFFKEINKPGGGKIIEFRESRKTEFSKNIIPNIDAVHFEVFRPMFEFIKTKI